MKKTYSTRDFYLSGYLIANGHKLVSHSRSNGKTNFVFDENEKMLVDEQKYYAMKGEVEPIAYSNALKSLKSVIHSYDSSILKANNEYVQQDRSKKE